MTNPAGRIRELIQSSDVVLFMKGDPALPQCGFSATVSGILSKLGVQFQHVDVLRDGAIREAVKAFSNWPTLPQLYVKGEFIGGCDIVSEMYLKGELRALFAEKSVPFGAGD